LEVRRDWLQQLATSLLICMFYGSTETLQNAARALLQRFILFYCRASVHTILQYMLHFLLHHLLQLLFYFILHVRTALPPDNDRS